jgi:hypothetical protein
MKAPSGPGAVHAGNASPNAWCGEAEGIVLSGAGFTLNPVDTQAATSTGFTVAAYLNVHNHTLTAGVVDLTGWWLVGGQDLDDSFHYRRTLAAGDRDAPCTGCMVATGDSVSFGVGSVGTLHPTLDLTIVITEVRRQTDPCCVKHPEG